MKYSLTIKKHLKRSFFLFALGICSGLFAQNPYNGKIRCSVNHHELDLQQKNPNRKIERQQYEKVLKQWTEKNKYQTSRAVITIPVVVHVLYNANAENISDAQIQSQIDALNADFNRTNADASSTPSAFQSIAGNPGIEFCLAQIDPNGNPTTGIVRKQTSLASFSDDDKVKSSSQGGDNAWSTTQYFNIWVCNLGADLLGYGEFPTSSATNTFGLVVNYTCFGTIGTAAEPYNKGRTSTHEVGHCFNLFHIWGDEPSCSEDDLVSDTPMQKGENYGCPSYPQTSESGGRCNNSDPSSMFMNYMDYSDDECMNMFSQGQATRMLAVLNNAPYNALKNSNKCSSSPAQDDDAGIASVSSPSGNICSSSVTPALVLKNYGANTLTSVTIKYKVDNNSESSYSWTGSLASQSTVTINLSSVSVAAGNHTFTAYTSNPNGNSDATSSNDQATASFTVNTEGQSLPFSYGFEPTTFAPSGWALNNNDAQITWARTTAAAKSGSASAYMENYNYNVNGEVDELILPSLNLGAVSNPALTFYLAYQLYTDPASPDYVSSDTLEILASDDCGASWTSLYNKAGNDLVTTSPAFSTDGFTPNATQWRMETIDLSSLGNGGNVMLKFKQISNYENNLYIDDINVDGITAVMHTNIDNLISVFPNPSTGDVFVNIENQKLPSAEILVYNYMGEKIIGLKTTSTGIQRLSLKEFGIGIYLVEVNSIYGKSKKKIVLTD